MTRAYLRLDPGFDEHKESYPDGPYATLIATLCAAETQPQRGRFRSVDYLRRLLGKRGRHVAFLVERGDLVELPDGRLYVDGWDEWQEGDWKVSERVSRIRNRDRRNGGGNGGCNGSGNGGVTVSRKTVGVAVSKAVSAAPDRSSADDGARAHDEEEAAADIRSLKNLIDAAATPALKRSYEQTLARLERAH